MPRILELPLRTPSEAEFAPYGWILGKGYPPEPSESAFSHPGSDYWHEHAFEPGESGETEVLWVSYRDDTLVLRKLEAHWKTQQAIVPLGPTPIVHVVCTGQEGAHPTPDPSRLAAFLIAPGRGICMKPGCWHATFVLEGTATCLMLTRRSTTVDLTAHLRGRGEARETTIVDLAAIDDRDIRIRP
jgi:ureidoglycolate lyase